MGELNNMRKKIKYLIGALTISLLTACTSEVDLENAVDLSQYEKGTITYLAQGEDYYNELYFYQSEDKSKEFVVNSNLENAIDSLVVYNNPNEEIFYKNENSGINYSIVEDIRDYPRDYDAQNDIGKIIKTTDIEYVGSGLETSKTKSGSTTTTTYDFEVYFLDKATNKYYESDVTEADALSDLKTIYGSKDVIITEKSVNSSLFGDKLYLNLNGFWVETEPTTKFEISDNQIY